MWGAEDLFAVFGGTANRDADGSYRDVAKHVRSQSLLARQGATDGWRWIRCTSTSRTSTACAPRSTTRSRSVSTPKSPSIPTQVAVIRAGYAPTADQVDWARHVLDSGPRSAGRLPI